MIAIGLMLWMPNAIGMFNFWPPLALKKTHAGSILNIRRFFVSLGWLDIFQVLEGAMIQSPLRIILTSASSQQSIGSGTSSPETHGLFLPSKTVKGGSDPMCLHFSMVKKKRWFCWVEISQQTNQSIWSFLTMGIAQELDGILAPPMAFFASKRKLRLLSTSGWCTSEESPGKTRGWAVPIFGCMLYVKEFSKWVHTI